MPEPAIPLSDSTGEQVPLDVLQDYMETRFRIKVQKISILDLNVHRVELKDELILVVRIFAQSARDVEDTAKLLEYLQQQGFPVEASIPEMPVSEFRPGESMLVTRFAEGGRPERNRRAFQRLGKLLGRLHSLPVPEGLRRGGAWHHLSLSGGLTEEFAAAKMRLNAFKTHSATDKHQDIDRLVGELSIREGFNALPLAIVHPDFVPPNVIENASSNDWTVVDWAGAGHGARVVSLGFLLMVAGARGKLALVDATMSGYGSYVSLEESELEHLPAAIYSRQLAIACWEVSVGRRDATDVLQGLPGLYELAGNVARRVREIVNKS